MEKMSLKHLVPGSKEAERFQDDIKRYSSRQEL